MSARASPRLGVRRFCACVASAVAMNLTVGAQQTTRLDQIFLESPNGGEVASVAARVDKNELAGVRYDAGGTPVTVEAARVQRIVWGEVPASFRAANSSLLRADHAGAVAGFREAAGDANARDVVRAAAKLAAAQALFAWGASDPTRFAEAATEAHSFITSCASNREVPIARSLQARATWLAGDAATAAVHYRMLYGELRGDTPTVGYGRDLCIDAGLSAARASLEAKDLMIAREIYRALNAQARRLLALESPSSTSRRRLQAVLDEASLGDGLVALADGKTQQALTFFQEQLAKLTVPSADSQRFAVYLGLAEALLAGGRVREAMPHFAGICALDTTLDRDRVAHATVGLAVCFTRLDDAESREQARLRLEAVLADFGDTPSAGQARAMLSELRR